MDDPISIALMEIETKQMNRRIASLKRIGVSASSIRRWIEVEMTEVKTAHAHRLLQHWAEHV